MVIENSVESLNMAEELVKCWYNHINCNKYISEKITQVRPTRPNPMFEGPQSLLAQIGKRKDPDNLIISVIW